MSLNFVAEKRTVCEVLREINDKLQGTLEHEKILPLLREAETMCKKMSRKLFEYNKDFDKDWWEQNKDVAEKLERRLNENYIP